VRALPEPSSGQNVARSLPSKCRRSFSSRLSGRSGLGAGATPGQAWALLVREGALNRAQPTVKSNKPVSSSVKVAPVDSHLAQLNQGPCTPGHSLDQ
jgi:hypothetical protein